jgi:hypothetical protein
MYNMQIAVGDNIRSSEYNPLKKAWIKIMTKEEDEVTTKTIKPKFVTLHHNMLLPFADNIVRTFFYFDFLFFHFYLFDLQSQMYWMELQLDLMTLKLLLNYFEDLESKYKQIIIFYFLLFCFLIL